MARITDLPNELLEDIVLKLRQSYCDENELGNVLATVSLVCRAFYRVAFRYMYSELDLLSREKDFCTKSRLCALLRLIQRNPERGYVVQTISVGPWVPTELSTLGNKHDAFRMSFEFLKRIIKDGKLEEQDLSSLENHPISVLITVLLYLLPKVEDLYLLLMSSMRGKPLPTRWLLLAIDMAPLPFKDKLRRLEFDHTESEDVNVIPCRSTVGALLDFPNLRTVRYGSESLTMLASNEISEYMTTMTNGEPALPLETDMEEHMSPDLFEAYKRFRGYDPSCLRRLDALRNTSSVTDCSFFNNPCSLLPVPEIIQASKRLTDFDCFISSRCLNTSESVQAIHQALMIHKGTLEDINMSYFKGFPNQNNPDFQLDFSMFVRLHSLRISLILLADTNSAEMRMGDALPVNLEKLMLKMRYPYSFVGGGGGRARRWDEAVIWVIRRIARMKDEKLKLLRRVDVQVINHPARPSKSEHLKEARELMEQRGIKFRPTTYDPTKGQINL